MEFMGNKPDTISNLKEKYKDGDVMAFAKKAEELSKDTRFINYYNIEEMHEAEKQDFYNTGKEDGLKEGKLEGEHQRSIEIAKNMLDLDIDIDKIVKATLTNNGHAIITADHGNAECMLNRNKIVTSHSSNPVPFILISEKYRNSKLKNNQSIASIAPTVLDILNIKKPKEMTQNSLLLNTLC